jgi:hypothetical protein
MCLLHRSDRRLPDRAARDLLERIQLIDKTMSDSQQAVERGQHKRDDSQTARLRLTLGGGNEVPSLFNRFP